MRLAALLGIVVVAYAVMLLVGGVAGIAIQVVAGDPLMTPFGQFVLAPIVNTLLVALTTVGSTAAYVNLRNAREGAVGVAAAFA